MQPYTEIKIFGTLNRPQKSGVFYLSTQKMRSKKFHLNAVDRLAFMDAHIYIYSQLLLSLVITSIAKWEWYGQFPAN